jgi:hypothetical protein
MKLSGTPSGDYVPLRQEEQEEAHMFSPKEAMLMRRRYFLLHLFYAYMHALGVLAALTFAEYFKLSYKIPITLTINAAIPVLSLGHVDIVPMVIAIQAASAIGHFIVTCQETRMRAAQIQKAVDLVVTNVYASVAIALFCGVSDLLRLLFMVVLPMVLIATAAATDLMPARLQLHAWGISTAVHLSTWVILLLFLLRVYGAHLNWVYIAGAGYFTLLTLSQLMQGLQIFQVIVPWNADLFHLVVNTCTLHYIQWTVLNGIRTQSSATHLQHAYIIAGGIAGAGILLWVISATLARSHSLRAKNI